MAYGERVAGQHGVVHRGERELDDTGIFGSAGDQRFHVSHGREGERQRLRHGHGHGHGVEPVAAVDLIVGREMGVEKHQVVAAIAEDVVGAAADKKRVAACPAMHEKGSVGFETAVQEERVDGVQCAGIDEEELPRRDGPIAGVQYVVVARCEIDLFDVREGRIRPLEC